MKTIVVAALLALLPAGSHAIRCIGGTAPVLHSVLDDRQPPRQFDIAPAKIVLTAGDLYYGQPGRPQDADQQVYYQRKRATASRLTVAGCFLTVGGSALLLSSANGNSSQASVTNTIFAVALLTGVGLLIAGISMNTRYGRHKTPH